MRAKGESGQRGDPVGTGDVHLSPVEGTHWDGLIAEELTQEIPGDSGEVVEAESPGWDTQGDLSCWRKGR